VAVTGLALLYPALWWSELLLAIMDIRAHPISFSDRPSKAGWVTRSRMQRRDRSPILKSDSQTSAGISFYFVGKGSTNAIPSEPPSLARPIRRARVVERGAIPLVNPERAHFMPLLR